MNRISFSDKGNFSNKIMISEKDCIVSDDRRVSEVFNEHFINTTQTLDLKQSIMSTATSLPEIIETFKDHPSIRKIFSLRRAEFKFHSINEFRNVILNMDGKKANQTDDIPARIFTDCVESYISILTKTLKYLFKKRLFPKPT